MKTSSYETKIINTLKAGAVNFVREKQFQDLQNGLYRFDFWIPKDKIAIEVQGIQHYEYTKAFFKKKSDFTKAQERDRRKINYCLANGILLYCIPFWEIDNINTYQDILRSDFLAHSMYHNDEAYRKYLSEKRKT